MTQFVKLDFLTLKPYYTSLLMLVGIGVMFSLFLEWAVSGLIMIMVVYLVMVAGYPFSIGDKANIDMFYTTLPLSRKQVVTGRYLFTLCLYAITILISLALIAVAVVVRGNHVEAMEVLYGISWSFLLFSFMVGVQFPLYFKMGYTKARLLANLPLFILGFLAMLGPVILEFTGREDVLSGMLNGFDQAVESHLGAMLAVPIVSGAILLAVSLAISRRFHAAKDL